MKLDISSLKCEVITPDQTQNPHDVVSRWSDGNVQVPALVVKPSTEADILAAIKVARDHKLTLLPASGGHGSFVPITPNTLYLDLRHFNSVVLDKTTGAVRVGGGASTGEVVKAVTSGGYYTLWPNSNAVGYVGCVLGGGSGTMNGVHGYMTDAVESFQVITAAGKQLGVSPASKEEEKALFEGLCGAGHGLGVVTSVVMKAWPIASLNMSPDGTWTRRLIFPPTAIDVAAEVFASFTDLAPALNVGLVFMRAPPTFPNAGAPLVMLTASYYGPSSDGEAAAKTLFDEHVVSKAVKADTTFAPMATALNALDAINAHGGYKDISSIYLHTADTATVQASYERWAQLTEQYPDAKPTMTIWARINTERPVALGQSQEGRGRFNELRDRPIMANTIRMCKSGETKKALDQYSDDFLAIVRRNESAPPRALPNNFRPGMELSELHSTERLDEARRLRATWDAERLFWSPY